MIIILVKKKIINKLSASPLSAIMMNFIKEPSLFKNTNLELKKYDAITEIKNAKNEEINAGKKRYDMKIKYDPK
jgi:hypothetical protein